MKTNGCGDKLRKLRNAYGLAQSEFGDKIGISRVRINSYENNITPLPTQVMWKIVEATGIGTEYFQKDLDIAGAT
ncbi:MAG: helix-turn-helix domain-containing protein [Campylobacter sp.]